VSRKLTVKSEANNTSEAGGDGELEQMGAAATHQGMFLAFQCNLHEGQYMCGRDFFAACLYLVSA